jgi:hypothetical protein
MIIAGLYYLGESLRRTKTDEEFKLMNPNNGPAASEQIDNKATV